MPRGEYPTEDPARNEDEEYPQQYNDDEPANDDENADAHSETPTEKYERRVREAESVWFSGYFSGASYLPKPKNIHASDLDESTQEELLAEKTYEVPRGYTYIKDNLPPVIQMRPTGKYRTSLIVFILLTCISFVCLLVSACPVPWFRGKDVTVGGLNYKGVHYTLYRQKGGSLPEVSLRQLRTCPIEKQFYQSIAASVIMATVFSFIAMVLAVVRLCSGKVSYGWIMLFGFFAFFWGLAGNAMSMSQFHLSRCGKPRYPEVARLDAGFALSLVAWVFECIGLLMLFVTTKMNVGPSLRSVRVMDTWFLLLLLVALALTVIGNATTTWKRHFGDSLVRVVRVTYWHTELIMGDGTNIIYGRAHYRCSAYNKRIKASISFLILASVFIFFAVMASIGAFKSRGMRLCACVFAIISWVFLTVSWVTSVAIFYRTLCTRAVPNTIYANYPGVPTGVYEGFTKFSGYGIAEGVALPIVAWVCITAAVIANIAIPWPQVKRF